MMSKKGEKQYLDLVEEVMFRGEKKTNRTGINTLSLFGRSLEFDLRLGFPLLTTKKINFKNIVHEVLWYFKGTDKITYLKENGVNVWNAWADENDSIGPTYGYQWRKFNGIQEDYSYCDQLNNIIHEIKTNPDSRRLIINGWNPLQLKEMRLPPCIVMLQFNVVNDYLDLQVYQRSADLALGVPYDIAEMALILKIIARITDKIARNLSIVYGDVHIYENHIEGLKEQLTREPHKLPEVVVASWVTDIDWINFEDIQLIGYTHEPFIKFDVAV